MTGPARNVSMYFSWSSRQMAAAVPGLSGVPITRARPRMLPSTREYPSLRITVSPMNPVYGAFSFPCSCGFLRKEAFGCNDRVVTGL